MYNYLYLYLYHCQHYLVCQEINSLRNSFQFECVGYENENKEQEVTKDDEPSDTLSLAEQSANNPEVIKNLIRNLKVKPVEDVIKNYEELVMMCDKTTALNLIRSLLKPKPGEKIPSDKDLHETLGWYNNTNVLLYHDKSDNDKSDNERGQGGVVQGLFSFFCNRSAAFSRHCAKNYVCMLNWILILAFRLRISNSTKYTDAAIIELIKNMHYELYGFLLKGYIAENFTTRTDGNANFYIEGAKKAMQDRIFSDGTVMILVSGIKLEVGEIPEPKDNYLPRKMINPRKMTIRSGGGGMNSTNKLTRKRHHRKNAHTIKVSHKPTGVKKTRRHVK